MVFLAVFRPFRAPVLSRFVPHFSFVFHAVRLLHATNMLHEMEERMIVGDGDRFIDLREIMRLVGLSSSTIYHYMKHGTFPRSCKLGGHLSRWSEIEVRPWMAARLAERPQ